jgi:GT2 family glycosyltransferase
LCRRFLEALYRHTNQHAFHLRAGLNAVSPETSQLVHDAAHQYGNVSVIESESNLYKLPMMRRLFHELPIESDWVIWFDDDSYPFRGDWLPGLELRSEAHPRVANWGKRFRVYPCDRVLDFIRSAAWYRGKPFLTAPPSLEKENRVHLEFVEGGFFAVRSAVIRALDWPDPRLIHNVDDYIFGEALRQNGYLIGQYYSGVRITDAPRRSGPDAPSMAFDNPRAPDVAGCADAH